MFTQPHLFLPMKCQGWEDKDGEISSEKSNSENIHAVQRDPSQFKYHCLKDTETHPMPPPKFIEIKKRQCISRVQSSEGDKWKGLKALWVLKTPPDLNEDFGVWPIKYRLKNPCFPSDTISKLSSNKSYSFSIFKPLDLFFTTNSWSLWRPWSVLQPSLLQCSVLILYINLLLIFLLLHLNKVWIPLWSF